MENSELECSQGSMKNSSLELYIQMGSIIVTWLKKATNNKEKPLKIPMTTNNVLVPIL